MENDRIYIYEPLWGEWYVKGFIGEGTFGRVYIIERKVQDTVYKAAAKLITIPTSQQKNEARRNYGSDARAKTSHLKEIVDNVVNEINLLNKLSGSGHIVEYKDHTLYQNEEEESWDVVIRMELLTDLREHFEKNPATVRDIIEMAKDICTGLTICAKYNIVHRDIKLDNIFVSEHGTYKIGDFGVSRFMGTGGASTVVGTYDYIAPEVIREGRYDGRVDIYSLGLVLYKLLNNDRMPFMPEYPAEVKAGESNEAYRQRITGSPLSQPMNAPVELWRVIEKACAYEPKNRFNSAIEMKKMLEDAERTLTQVVLNRIVYPPSIKVNPFVRERMEVNNIDSVESDPEVKKQIEGTIPIFERNNNVPYQDEYSACWLSIYAEKSKETGNGSSDKSQLKKKDNEVTADAILKFTEEIGSSRRDEDSTCWLSIYAEKSKGTENDSSDKGLKKKDNEQTADAFSKFTEEIGNPRRDE